MKVFDQGFFGLRMNGAPNVSGTRDLYLCLCIALHILYFSYLFFSIDSLHSYPLNGESEERQDSEAFMVEAVPV